MDEQRAQDAQDDEEREQIRTFPGFLAGEWSRLWPVWALAAFFVAVIIWDQIH